MKTKNLILSGSLFVGLFIFNACNNNETKVTPESGDINTDVIEQEIALEDLEESVFDELDSYFAEEIELAGISGLKSAAEDDKPIGCPTITIDRPEDAKYPKIVTFDFGIENCEDRFGRIKRGQVIVTVTDRHWNEGATRTVEFKDFYVNDNSITGSKINKNEGKDEDNHWYFSHVIDVTIETTEGITWNRKVDKIRTMVAGDETKAPRDDAFLITGTSSGTSSKGYSVSRKITTPVYRERVCRFPLSGIIEIIRTKDEVSTTIWLDYGNAETCDYKATVTNAEGEIKEIALGRRFKKK